MKYIMFKSNDELERKIPVIFPDLFVHEDVARNFEIELLRIGIDSTPVSAGFINLKGECHGKSETLNLKSDSEDTAVVNSYDHFHGLIY